MRDRFWILNFGLGVVDQERPPVAGGTRRLGVVSWFMLGLVLAIAIGWIAAKVHATGHAPVGLTSFGVGAVLGIVLRASAAMLRVGELRSLVVSTLLLASLTIVAEHVWLYRDFRRQWHEQRTKSAPAAMFAAKPPSAKEYYTHEWNPVLWITDAALIMVTATSVVAFRRETDSVSNVQRSTMSSETDT